MLVEILQSPLFIGTATYAGMLLFLPRMILIILEELSGGFIEKKKIDSKINYYYFIFIQFVITIFAMMVSIFLYNLMAINLGESFIFQKYSNVLQICTIVIAIFIIRICTRKCTVRPSGMNDEQLQKEISSLRILGSIFAVAHLFFIKYLCGTNQYDSLLVCYVGLIIGRFIYYDSSLNSIWSEIRKMAKHLWVVFVTIVAMYIPLYFLVFKDVSIHTGNILFSICSIYLAMIMGINSYKDVYEELFCSTQQSQSYR